MWFFTRISYARGIVCPQKQNFASLIEQNYPHTWANRNFRAPLHHRNIGAVGWGLSRDEITCDIIADGVHIDRLILQLIVRHKTARNVSLISDAIAAVRRALWSAPGFSMSQHPTDSVKIPTALMERLTDALCYAA